MSDNPLPLRILELRAQVAELSSTIRQLQRSGLDEAAPRLRWYDDKADHPTWIKALADVRRQARLEGYRYQHVQAIIVAIDQYAEAALGNRGYFLNKPHRVG